jgi:hypothetical protein
LEIFDQFAICSSEVIKIDADHPNLQAIAEESAKIAFVQNFMNGPKEDE